MPDRTASVELLLSHEPFLRRLARSLVYEDARVDDLVQETWVRALKHRPRVSGLRAWLATVTRNIARQRWREENRRRRRHARVARPEAAADESHRDQVRQRVVDAVLRLDEPYRTTVLLRFLDGLPPREIAARQDVPVETVRTRLKRGLHRLRTELRAAPEFESWSLALVALLDPLPRRRTGIFAAAVGVVAMNLKAVLVLCGIMAAVVAWQVVPERTVPDRAPARDEATTGKGAAAAPPSAETTPVTPEAEDLDGVPGVWLRGRIIKTRAGTGSRTVLEVRKPGHTEAGEEIRGVAQPDGSFELDVARLIENLDDLLLVVDHPDHVRAVESFPLVRGAHGAVHVDPVEVRLRLAAVVTGRVVRSDGSPIAAARVAVFARGRGTPVGEPIETARADAQGRYRLRAVDNGSYLVMAAPKGWRPGFTTADLEVGVSAAAPPIALVRGVAVEGRVTVNSRPAQEAASLSLRRGDAMPVQWAGLGWLDGGLIRREVTTATRADGRFRFAGLDEGAHEIAYRWQRTFAQVLRKQVPSTPVVAPASNVELNLAIAFVRFHLRTPAGPLANRSFLVGTKRARYGRRVDEEGNVRLGMLAEHDYVLELNHPPEGFAPVRREFRTPAAGQTLDLHVELLFASEPPKPQPRYAKLVFEVTAEGAGRAPRTIGVGFWREGSSRLAKPDFSGSETADERGVFTSLVSSPGGYRVAVRPGGWLKGRTHWQDAWAEVDLAEDEVMNLRFHVRAGGRLRLVARAPGGEPLEAACVILDADGRNVATQFHRTRLDAWESSRAGELSKGLTDLLPALAPGTYTVELSHGGYRAAVRAVRIEAGATVTLDVTLDAE